MNIGIVTMWFERGAGYVSRQYRKLLSRKHNVFIYARVGQYPKGNLVWDDETVTWGKPSLLPVATAIDYGDFVRWIQEKQIDLVFFNEQHWWEPLQWCLKLGIKTGAYIDYYTEATVPFFGSYDFLICNTKRHYSVFSWHPQAFYVPWGTDIDLFKPHDYQPVDPERITFFHSCGFDPYRKGVDFILEAFVHMEHAANLIIHTQVPLEQRLPTYTKIISDLRERGRLKIIQETVTAPGLYHLGDVYLGLSRLEGIGLPLAESIACGLPLVTNNYPPMNEFVTETSGAVVEIESLWSRSDGYYWPQCRPRIQHLAEVLDMFVLKFDRITDHKRLARSYAENHLNWLDRTEQVEQIFVDTKVDVTNKEQAVAEALRYEHIHQGVQYKVSKEYPMLWSLYHHLKQGVRRIK